MADKELRELLRQVHVELDETDAVSDEERQLLDKLMIDIRARLGESDEDEHGLGDRLDDAIEQFNVSHPTLAFALRRIMDALGKMGI